MAKVLTLDGMRGRRKKNPCKPGRKAKRIAGRCKCISRKTGGVIFAPARLCGKRSGKKR